MIVIRIGKQVRELYVAIEDPRKLIKALNMLTYFKAYVRGVDIDTKHIQGVVLLDSKGYNYLVKNNIKVSGYIINIDECEFEKGIAKAIIYAKTLIVNPLKKVVIGIDFGRSIGVAVVVNDDVVYTHSYRSVDRVLKDVWFFINNVDSDLKVVRVGVVQDIDEEFANTVVEMFKNIANIEFVPEHKSSSHRYLLEDVKLTSDEVAAINIAFYRSKAID